MGTTTSGLVYPDPGDDVQLWQHFQNLADSIEPFIRRPLCVVFKADASGTDRQLIESGGSGEDVTWTAERIDTNGMHSTSVNPERITPDREGYYRAYAHIVFERDLGSDTEVGERRVNVTKNGSIQAPVGRTYVDDIEYSPQLATETILAMNGTTDYFTARVYQNTGNSKYLFSAASFTCYMSVEYIRPLFA